MKALAGARLSEIQIETQVLSTCKTKGQYMKSPLMNQPIMAVWKGRATWLAAIPALVILCLAAANPPDSDTEHMDRDATGIEGTWRVELSPEGPVPPNFPPLPWHGLKTFNRGGTMMESNELPGNRNAHGVWQKIGPRLFALTFEFFWDDPALGSGKTKVRETIQLNHELNAYETVESLAEDYDRDGHLLYAAYGGTSHGTRMQVEPVQ